MKHTKRLIALLAAAALLCACSRQDASALPDTTAAPAATESIAKPETTVETTVPETTAPETTAPAPTPINLVTDGKADYVIVCPEHATDAERKAAAAIRDGIFKQTGEVLSIKNDWIKAGGTYDAAAREILIGGCAQSEVETVRSDMRYSEYAVRFCGSKLVVTAWSDDALSRAASLLLGDLQITGGTVTLSSDYSLTGGTDNMIDLLPRYTGGRVSNVVDCADDNRMLYITNTTADEYRAYCKQLEAAGFTLYTEREAAGNLFATYTSEKHTVTAYYTACDAEARVIIEPASALPPRAEDTTTTNDKYEPAVRMVGLEYNYNGDGYNQIGLMLLFRLPDGRLIVVDGGSYVAKNAALLYKNMRELAPDKDNIVIAAWVLTHAHGDHTGGYNQFAEVYAGRIKVERVIHNFTTKAQYALVNDYGRDDQSRETAEKLADAVIKAHNGQLYHFGGATMEILYTFEDFEPEALPFHNTTSLIFRISMGGQTVMVLGDAYTLSNGIVSKMYGSYLKSDIVQVSHHGYVGGTVEVYSLIDADTAIWPGGLRNFDKLSIRDENTYVVKNARDLYIAGDDVVTLTLPYTPVGNNPKYAG
ncbi:MAG: MBL fold metallo-hydrolase [Clostridia bacterium]|nr:MBL fold metallo-hydrolase [Clostridia bacterium]